MEPLSSINKYRNGGILPLLAGSHDTSYRLLVKIAILLHCIENFVLVTLTSVSSSENLRKYGNMQG